MIPLSPALSRSSRSSRGQTSLETLLVVAFILMTATLIAVVYFENQAKTNVTIQAKLLLLPYLERNGYLLKIAEIRPVVTPVGLSRDIDILVRTKGRVQAGLIAPAACAELCAKIDPAGYYSTTFFHWTNEEGVAPPADVCAPVSC